MERIGLFGGSFDPVHCGHWLVAQAALEELQLTRLYFIPAAQSPFKPQSEPAPAAQRVRLLRLALAGQTRCEIDTQEILRGGMSYTIDTVRDYARRFPRAQLCYLIGADHLGQLSRWRAAGELAQLTQFVAVPRPGQAGTAAPRPFRVLSLHGFPLAVSSSQVRTRIRSGLSVAGLVPPAVAEAIAREGWYR